MTKPVLDKHQRLLAIERQLRCIREELPEVLALKALTAQQAATITRLIGENEALRRNRTTLVQEIDQLRARLVARAEKAAA
jgi:hypothetical protein